MRGVSDCMDEALRLETLRAAYVDEGMSQLDAGLEAGMSLGSVQRALIQMGWNRSPAEVAARGKRRNGWGGPKAARAERPTGVHTAYAGTRGAHRRRGWKVKP